MKQGIPAILPKMMGGGYMAFTVDQQQLRNVIRYCRTGWSTFGRYDYGLVQNSEQLGASVLTAAQKTETGWVASAFMLQQIAADGGARSHLKRQRIYGIQRWCYKARCAW